MKYSFSSTTLLVVQQEGHLARENLAFFSEVPFGRH